MYHARFDYAVLSLFTHEMLATPFTVEQKGEDVWFVFSEGKCIGRITKEMVQCYRVDAVVFIPAGIAVESSLAD